MALKYSIDYPDVIDVAHRLEIYDDSYSGAEIPIDGVVYFDYASTDNPLEAIRGHGLRVELEANASRTFSDLYSEEQRVFPVVYKRNSVVLFNGWINSDGWFEDYVNSVWKVSFDCIDGLSLLEDLAFVEDATGLNFIGIKTQLELLSLALIRTGLQQNINVDIQIYYVGLSAVSILDNVNARCTRYIKDDDNTVMSCEDVVRDILEPYGACITSYLGEWWIYKPNQIYSSETLSYYRYDYLGAALSPTTATKDIDYTIGSGDGFSLFHVNANQSISKKNSIGVFRINYKYGRATSLIDNSFFYTADGTTLDDWTIDSMTNVTLAAAGGSGVLINAPTAATGIAIQNLSTEAVGLSQEDIIKLKWCISTDLPMGSGFNIDWKYQIVSTNASDGNIFYLKPGFGWEATGGVPWDLTYNFTGGIVNFEKDLQPLPQDGKVKIYIYGGQTNVAPAYFSMQFNEVALEPSQVDENAKGEIHTIQRTDIPARKADDVVEVFTGDTASDKFVGTLYKADTSSPTTQWYRTGITETKPILQIYGEEVIRLSQSPSMVFSGDVFGYFPYLSQITLDGLTGVFMPISWSYNTQANLISCIFRQLYGAEVDDFLYEMALDYGNVVKPTIRGTYNKVFPGTPSDVTPPATGTLNTVTEV